MRRSGVGAFVAGYCLGLIAALIALAAIGTALLSVGGVVFRLGTGGNAVLESAPMQLAIGAMLAAWAALALVVAGAKVCIQAERE